MYNEEYLPQDDVYQNSELDDVTVSVESDDDTEIIQFKQYTQLKKSNDPGYKKYKFELTSENSPNEVEADLENRPRYFNVESYSTVRDPNARIRHSITGFRTPHQVSSKEDDLYFSVVDTLSENGRKLYYNSPEEFERHFRMNLPQSVKDAWYEKKIMIRSRA